jgi:nitrite reductase/ring-hydroxylating ferredoxin subunit
MSADGTPSGRANAPYSGYYNQPAPAKPDPLTEVGPGTPAGEYLRRFWHPFLLSSELGQLPKVIKVLGEELVVFRDGSGRIGLVHKHCVHRGVSLEFGIVGQRGITCCYHGWKYDVDGTILETPAEPANSKIKERFSLGAYPVIEEHGMIFTYMGPPELKPEFPRYDCYNYPSPNKLVPLKMEVPCNWLQVHENACDPAHTTYLHAVVSAAQFERTFTALPALDFIPTPLGFAAPATRRLKDMVFIRTNDLIMPNIVQVTGSKGLGLEESYMVAALLTRWATPADDHNTYYIGYVHENAITGNESKRSLTTPVGLNRMNLIGQTAYRPYEERQIEPGDYDAMISPGPIVNRAAEHLASTDGGVALFRRMLAREIARVERGEEPEYPKVRGAEPVRTYCYSASMKIGNAKIDGMDGLHDFGKRVTQLVIDSADVAPEERERICEERTRALLAEAAG